MNRRARAARAARHALREPDRARRAGQLLDRRATSSKLALRAARATRSSAQTVDRRARSLHTGAHQRTVVNRNALVRRVPCVNGVKTGHTQQRRLRARRLGARATASTLVSAVLGDPSEARARRRHARAAALRPVAATAASPRRARRRHVVGRARRSRSRDDARRARAPARTCRASSRARRARCVAASPGAPDRARRAAAPRARASARVVVRQRGRVVGARAAGHRAPRSTRADRGQRPMRGWLDQPVHARCCSSSCARL